MGAHDRPAPARPADRAHVGRRGARSAVAGRRRHAGVRRHLGLHRADREAVAARPHRRRGDRRDAQPGLRAHAAHRRGARRRAVEVRRRRAAVPLPRGGPLRAGVRRRGRDAGRAAPGRRGAHVGRTALAVDVGRHPFRGRPPLPGRLAHPRAAHPRACRDADGAGGEGGRRRPDRRQRRDRRPGSPRMRSGRARTGSCSSAAARRARRRGRPSWSPTSIATACADCSRTSWGEYLDPGAPDPEHRTACIAFIRFSGTDALLAGPGPEALAVALHRTVSLVEEALAPEAISLLATDIDSDGGKFFLGVGHPDGLRRQRGPDAARPAPRSPTRARRCRCSSGSTVATCSLPRWGSPSAPRTPGWATRPTPRPGSCPRRRRASSTPTPRSSSTRGPCSPSSRPGRSR